MSNKKQSSVDLILNAFNLLSDADFKAWMLNNYDEIKAMHKDEIENSWWAGCDEGASPHIIFPSEDCNGYYNETFGGNNE